MIPSNLRPLHFLQSVQVRPDDPSSSFLSGDTIRSIIDFSERFCSYGEHHRVDPRLRIPAGKKYSICRLHDRSHNFFGRDYIDLALVCDWVYKGLALGALLLPSTRLAGVSFVTAMVAVKALHRVCYSYMACDSTREVERGLKGRGGARVNECNRSIKRNGRPSLPSESAITVHRRGTFTTKHRRTSSVGSFGAQGLYQNSTSRTQKTVFKDTYAAPPEQTDGKTDEKFYQQTHDGKQSSSGLPINLIEHMDPECVVTNAGLANSLSSDLKSSEKTRSGLTESRDSSPFTTPPSSPHRSGKREEKSYITSPSPTPKSKFRERGLGDSFQLVDSSSSLAAGLSNDRLTPYSGIATRFPLAQGLRYFITLNPLFDPISEIEDKGLAPSKVSQRGTQMLRRVFILRISPAVLDLSVRRFLAGEGTECSKISDKPVQSLYDTFFAQCSRVEENLMTKEEQYFGASGNRWMQPSIDYSFYGRTSRGEAQINTLACLDFEATRFFSQGPARGTIALPQIQGFGSSSSTDVGSFYRAPTWQRVDYRNRCVQIQRPLHKGRERFLAPLPPMGVWRREQAEGEGFRLLWNGLFDRVSSYFDSQPQVYKEMKYVRFLLSCASNFYELAHHQSPSTSALASHLLKPSARLIALTRGELLAEDRIEELVFCISDIEHPWRRHLSPGSLFLAAEINPAIFSARGAVKELVLELRKEGHDDLICRKIAWAMYHAPMMQAAKAFIDSYQALGVEQIIGAEQITADLALVDSASLFEVSTIARSLKENLEAVPQEVKKNTIVVNGLKLTAKGQKCDLLLDQGNLPGVVSSMRISNKDQERDLQRIRMPHPDDGQGAVSGEFKRYVEMLGEMGKKHLYVNLLSPAKADEAPRTERLLEYARAPTQLEVLNQNLDGWLETVERSLMVQIIGESPLSHGSGLETGSDFLHHLRTLCRAGGRKAELREFVKVCKQLKGAIAKRHEPTQDGLETHLHEGEFSSVLVTFRGRLENLFPLLVLVKGEEQNQIFGHAVFSGHRERKDLTSLKNLVIELEKAAESLFSEAILVPEQLQSLFEDDRKWALLEEMLGFFIPRETMDLPPEQTTHWGLTRSRDPDLLRGAIGQRQCAMTLSYTFFEFAALFLGGFTHYNDTCKDGIDRGAVKLLVGEYLAALLSHSNEYKDASHLNRLLAVFYAPALAAKSQIVLPERLELALKTLKVMEDLASEENMVSDLRERFSQWTDGYKVESISFVTDCGLEVEQEHSLDRYDVMPGDFFFIRGLLEKGCFTASSGSPTPDAWVDRQKKRLAIRHQEALEFLRQRNDRTKAYRENLGSFVIELKNGEKFPNHLVSAEGLAPILAWIQRAFGSYAPKIDLDMLEDVRVEFPKKSFVKRTVTYTIPIDPHQVLYEVRDSVIEEEWSLDAEGLLTNPSERLDRALADFQRQEADSEMDASTRAAAPGTTWKVMVTTTEKWGEMSRGDHKTFVCPNIIVEYRVDCDQNASEKADGSIKLSCK